MTNPSRDKYLNFEHELAVLSHAELFIAEARSLGSEWVPHMERLKDEYERLLRIAKKLISIGDVQGKALMDRLEMRAAQEHAIFYDSLTDCYNRAFAENFLSGLLEAHMPFSILFADMNGLKLANDVYGHGHGDLLLQRAAALLKSCCRSTDYVVRWGGDEFLILLPNTIEKDSYGLMNRIKRACQDSPADPIKVRLAIGSASIMSPEGEIKPILAAAEERMYRNKHRDGRRIHASIVSDVHRMLIESGLEDAGHLERIAQLLHALNDWSGQSDGIHMYKRLEWLASMHHVGKIRNEYFLADTQKQAETDIELGYVMARSIGEYEVAEALLSWHEHWDGAGIPYGLAGDQIPRMARMLAIVHEYDILTNADGMDEALNVEQAARRIGEYAGTRFDPWLAGLFASRIGELSEG